MILLTDEAIGKVIRKSLGNELPELEDYTWTVTEEDKAIAKEQIKNVVEELTVFAKRYDMCIDGFVVPWGFWQSLLKELE